MEWASGNAGYAMTGVAKTADDYPTFQITDGKAGKCLSLVTRSTGFFGQIAGMPIAAGNLFIGSFDVSNAMSNPLKATKFGLPFRHVPTYLAGYYKYKAGDQFTEGGKPVNGKRDICDIYAIMYETSESVPTLDGTNAFTSPNLISTARINNAKETNEWTYFKLPFTTLPGKFIDKEKLMDGKYNIAIVFTSSLEGDHFNGAIGSTLLIDEAELIYHSEAVAALLKLPINWRLSDSSINNFMASRAKGSSSTMIQFIMLYLKLQNRDFHLLFVPTYNVQDTVILTYAGYWQVRFHRLYPAGLQQPV